jgi:hypothetical protein
MLNYVHIRPVGVRYAVCIGDIQAALFNDYYSAWLFREASKREVTVR